MKKLSNWSIDNEWIESVLLKAKNYQTVSFDVFDTVITRVFDSPVDIFARVENDLLKMGYVSAKGFAGIRETAEQNARVKYRLLRNAEDISLDEIYGELPPLNKKFILWDEAKKLELQAERAYLFAVPDMLDLIGKLQKAGKNIIFVSDMYLPSDFISGVLRDCGYNGWTDLIVSNEVNLTKASGNIWPLIKQRYADGGILHIGDDEWSDMESPQRYGIACVPFTRARSERRTAGNIRPEILAYSKAARLLTLARRGSLHPVSGSAIYEDLGRSYGVLIVGGFLKWLIKRAKMHDVKHLYFCARDGYLLQQVWNRLNFSETTGLSASYLEVARRPLNLARGYAESSSDRLDDRLIEFLCSSDGSTTVEAALKRIGLGEDETIVRSALARFGSLQDPVTHDGGVSALSDIFRSHSKIVYNQLAGNYDRLLKYLEQEDMFADRKIAIIDMGWHGTMQRSLQRLIDPSEKRKNKIFGFYYGLWPKTLENIHASGLMESAYANMFLTVEHQPEVHENVEILEELHSAPHGTVLDYQVDSQGRWSSLTADSPLEMEQFEQITQHFQMGVIEEMAAIYAGDGTTGLSVDDLTIGNGLGAMGMVALSPSTEELGALSKLGHCATFDHMTLSPIIPQAIPENRELIYKAFWMSHWRMGMLRHWLSFANPEQRNIILEIAHNHMGHHHGRTKRVFQ